MAGLFDELIVPIPDCTDLIEHFGKERGFTTPSKVADEMLREARKWQRTHPEHNVSEVMPPNWKEYIEANL